MIKHLLLSVVLAIGLSTASHAATLEGSYGWWDSNSTGNISSSSWSPMISSLTKSIKGVAFLNGTTSDLYLGIGFATAASSGDVAQLIMPSTPRVSQVLAPGLTYVPFSASQGYRISVKSVGSSATSGIVEINALYY